MTQKILLVSYHAPPVINAESILVWKTARALARHCDLNIITARVPGNVKVDEQMFLPANVIIHRRTAFNPANALMQRAMAKFVGFVADEQYLWTKFRQHFTHLSDCDVDVIYSRSHPGASHILAYKIKKKLHKPWVAQFSDPWTRNPYHKNHSFLRKAFDRRWERKVVKFADVLVFPTREIQEMYCATYGQAYIESKSIILPHHYTPEFYQGGMAVRSATGDTISFSYFGDFYGARSPEPFLAGLRYVISLHPELATRMKVTFYGNVESKFDPLLQQSPIPINRDKVPYRESLQHMMNSDVLLLVDAPSENGVNPFLASKLIDYLGAGKRILGITDLRGTAADILRKYGHHVVSPHGIEDISAAILQCMDKQQFPIIPPEEFTTQSVVGRLTQVLTQAQST